MKVSSTFYGLLCKKYKDVIILSFLKNTETIFVIYKIIENYWKIICGSYSGITSTHNRAIIKSTQLKADRQLPEEIIGIHM